MEQSEASIKRLGRLTGGLAEKLVEKFGPDGLKQPGDPDPWSMELEGRTFGRWMQEFWPGQIKPGAPYLSQAAIEALIAERSHALDEARRQIEAREQELTEAQDRLAAETNLPQNDVEQCRVRLARSESKLGRLKARHQNLLQTVGRQKTQIKDLKKWLGGLTPRGLNRFSDSTGRPVSQAEIKANTRKLENLKHAVADNWGDAVRARRGIEDTLAQCGQAQEGLKTLTNAGLKADQILARQAEDLETQRQELRQRRHGLAPLKEALQRARDLERLHDQVLSMASRALTPFLLAPRHEPVDAPAKAVRTSITQADLAAERINRLENLLKTQTGFLKRTTERLTAALARARKINQEISGLQKEMPQLFNAIVHPGEGRLEQRSQSAVRITSLIARLDDLSPQAIEVHGEVDRLGRKLTMGLKRAGRLQKAWRQAGVRERKHFSQACLLIENIKRAARTRKKQSEDLAIGMAPAVAALSPLKALELEPQLVALTSQVAKLRFESLELKILGVELDGEIRQPLIAPQAKSPVSLKFYSKALKSISVKQVQVEDIYTLSVAAQRWFDLAAGPLVKDIRRPAEELAKKLSEKVDRLSSQKADLEAIRQRHEEQLSRLREELQDERRVRQDIMDRLDQTHEMLSRQNGMLTRYKADVRQTSTENRQVKEELNAERSATAELNRLLEQTTGDLTRRLNQTASDLTGKLEETTRDYEERLERTNREWDQRYTSATDQYKCELESTREDLTRRLAETTLAADQLATNLERSQKLAKALKSKSLERHRLYRKSRHAIEWMDYWKERALEHESLLKRTRAELDQARSEYEQARSTMVDIARNRELAESELAAERAAKARETLDLTGGKALSAELAASQDEAGRWAALAGQLAVALSLNGKNHEKHTQELQAQVNQLSSEAAQLKKQLAATAHLMQAADEALPQSVRPATVTVRVSSMEPEQIYSALDRLGKSRRRLQDIGRSTLGHMAVVAALTGGLVLIPPGNPTTATRTEAPLTSPVAAVNQTSQDIAQAPLYNLPASAGWVGEPPSQGALEMNLIPIRKDQKTIHPAAVRGLKRLAKKAGIPHEVILTSARASYNGEDLIESERLRELAQRARRIALSLPHIRTELGHNFQSFDTKLNSALKKGMEDDRTRFTERLYREYRALGFSPAESLGAMVANEKALEKLDKTPLSTRYLGKALPLGSVETMQLGTFVKRMTPYIKRQLNIFMKQRSLQYDGDLGAYAEDLAFDMHCASKLFKVPLTILMAIAHQETWYANVLGDQNRSASPFQIYAPTCELIRKSMSEEGFVPPPKGVRLERHLTLATYMAAYHLRELMAGSVVKRKGKLAVNLNQVLFRYNGSVRYISMVASKRQQLAKFIGKTG